MNKERLKFLLKALSKKEISGEEAEELLTFIGQEGTTEEIETAILNEWSAIELISFQEENDERERLFSNIIQTIKPKNADDNVPLRTIQEPRKTGIRVWWSAACFILAIAGSVFFILNKKDTNGDAIVAKNEEKKGSNAYSIINKAALTLEDGTVVELDSAGKLELQQSQAKILQNDGHLDYSVTGNRPLKNNAAHFNTLSTSRGSQYNVTLSDGTRIWLNAASSITYPVFFTDTERKVKIKGEAYFEVAHNKKAHFHVMINDSTEVSVLGTHFNINSYYDESDIKITLLQGKVNVKALQQNGKRHSQMLNPGQQSRISAMAMKLEKNVNIDNVIAWKNGAFSFENASLGDIMRQLSRWYNIEVKYEGKIPMRDFSGKIGKNLTLEQALEVLTQNNVRFKIDNNTVNIMQ
ncbi:MAG: FecR domain-containing protein [Chitinophagaceae bacterium]